MPKKFPLNNKHQDKIEEQRKISSLGGKFLLRQDRIRLNKNLKGLKKEVEKQLLLAIKSEESMLRYLK